MDLRGKKLQENLFLASISRASTKAVLNVGVGQPEGKGSHCEVGSSDGQELTPLLSMKGPSAFVQCYPSRENGNVQGFGEPCPRPQMGNQGREDCEASSCCLLSPPSPRDREM